MPRPEVSVAGPKGMFARRAGTVTHFPDSDTALPRLAQDAVGVGIAQNAASLDLLLASRPEGDELELLLRACLTW